MKKNFHIISSSIIFYLLYFLISLSYEKEIKYIKEEIYIDEDKNPYIKILNGGSTSKFLISLSSPILFTFKNDNNNINDNNENPYLYTSIYNEAFSYLIKEGMFLLNHKFNYGYLINESNSNLPSNYGLLGLGRGKLGVNKDFDNSNRFLQQLLNKNLISKEIIYIGPYYKNNILLDKSNILIGKIDDSLVKKKYELPYCILYNNSDNYYDCKISNFTIEDKNKNNITSIYHEKKNNFIIAIFEERSIQPIYLPKSLYKKFKDYFNNKNCSCDEKKIVCDTSIKESINISLVINNYKFILNPEYVWNNGQLNFVFNRKDNIVILSSGFTGYYHRIYDNYNQKIFFSDENGNIISLRNKKNNDIIYWAIYLSASGLILIISIIIIIIGIKKWKRNLEEEVNSISFQKQRDEDNENEKDGTETLV